MDVEFVSKVHYSIGYADAMSIAIHAVWDTTEKQHEWFNRNLFNGNNVLERLIKLYTEAETPEEREELRDKISDANIKMDDVLEEVKLFIYDPDDYELDEKKENPFPDEIWNWKIEI